MSNQLPTDADADPIIMAMRRMIELHPRTFVGFDFGNEIEHANKLRERADGSFYTRGPCVGDQDAAEIAADHKHDDRD